MFHKRNKTLMSPFLFDDELLGSILNHYLLPVEKICAMRTCKRFAKLITNQSTLSRDVMKQYERMQVCSICKCKCRGTVCSRFKMFAHTQCVWKLHDTWIYTQEGYGGGIMYRPKVGRTPDKAHVKIKAPKYVDVINVAGNWNTVSTVYRRMSPRNHNIMEYSSVENRLLKVHLWMQNYHTKLDEWENKYARLMVVPMRKRLVLDITKAVRMILAMPKTKLALPRTQEEYYQMMILVYGMVQDFVAHMAGWFGERTNRRMGEWFSEVHSICTMSKKHDGAVNKTVRMILRHLTIPQHFVSTIESLDFDSDAMWIV